MTSALCPCLQGTRHNIATYPCVPGHKGNQNQKLETEEVSSLSVSTPLPGTPSPVPPSPSSSLALCSHTSAGHLSQHHHFSCLSADMGDVVRCSSCYFYIFCFLSPSLCSLAFNTQTYCSPEDVTGHRARSLHLHMHCCWQVNQAQH